jgi:nucleoside-diphosphate-sugar epimerase
MNAADTQAFLDCLRGAVGRIVAISSGDVYRAYGRLTKAEPGPPDPVPLSEDAPLRESRYPYRGMPNLPIQHVDEYDKILVEATLRSQSDVPVTILRFPAVYGPNDGHRFGPWLDQMKTNDDLRIGEGLAAWRWTHGYCEDVADAVVRTVADNRAEGRIYNVGEKDPPPLAERLAEWGRIAGWNGRVIAVPDREMPVNPQVQRDYCHHIVTDTSRIRAELGYGEVVPREEGIARTIEWERRLE